MYTDWPTKGDSRKQPWEVEDSGIKPRAGLPTLSAGSADPQAPDFFRQLADLGYESPISRGERAHGVVGVEEMAAVRQFRNDHGVVEEPTAFGGDNPVGREVAENHIGPWTLEAIIRAHSALQADDDDAPAPASAKDVAELQAQVKRLNNLTKATPKAKPKPRAKSKA